MGSAFMMGVLGFLSCSIGMIIGGILASFFGGAKTRYIPIIFSFCSGLIFGLVLLDIIPESIELGGYVATTTGLMLGVFSFRYLHKMSHIISLNTNNRYASTGVILAFSIALHNFPSGVAIGASTKGLTTAMMTTMILHTIPEGIAVFTPLFVATFPAKIIFPTTALVSLPVGVGALIGSAVGLKSPFLLSIIISLSMAIVLLVTAKEILGEALIRIHLLLCLFVLSVGFILIWLFL